MANNYPFKMGSPLRSGFPIRSTKDKGDMRYEFEFKSVKVFHMKNFYKFVYWWMTEEGWRAQADEDDYDDFPETFYEEWRLPEGHMERRIWWRWVYNPESPHGRGTARFRYFVDMNFKNLFLKNVDTVVSGRKVKAQEGEVEVKVKAYLKVFDEEIKEHPILGLPGVYYFFRKRWIKHDYEGYRDDMRVKMRKLQDAMKDFMNMATYEDDAKNFHLERGL